MYSKSCNNEKNKKGLYQIVNWLSDYDSDKSPSSWNLAMSIFVDRGKPENPEKISSEQGREPTTLKRKALMTPSPGFDPGHIGARQALSPLRHHNLFHDLSQNTRLVIRAWVADIYR